jgi:predicted small secreted protein
MTRTVLVALIGLTAGCLLSGCQTLGGEGEDGRAQDYHIVVPIYEVPF